MKVTMNVPDNSLVYPFDEETTKHLMKDVNPKRVKHRPGGGGMQVSYLEGFDVIDTANRIFGFGMWGWSVLQNTLVPITNMKGEIVAQVYQAIVQVRVNGKMPVTETGQVAVQTPRNDNGWADAHDVALKGAITDALKRGLRAYGDQFGNSLYDRALVDGQPDKVSTKGVQEGRKPERPDHPEISMPVTRPVLVQPALERKTEEKPLAVNVVLESKGKSGTQDKVTLQDLTEKYGPQYNAQVTTDALSAIWKVSKEEALSLGFSEDEIKSTIGEIMGTRYRDIKAGKVKTVA